jgi:L-amino acid N-acyltransferase YncA
VIVYTTASSPSDLEGILSLQQANLAERLSAQDMRQQGFVTVMHSYGQLAALNEVAQHVVAKDAERVVGYLLAMTPAARDLLPVLIPMFMKFDELRFNGKAIADLSYIVVGQACIDRPYRGTGVLERCYTLYRERYAMRYDFAITEIATENPRSLAAHKRIGFNAIGTYKAPDGVDWTIVAWDWHVGI